MLVGPRPRIPAPVRACGFRRQLPHILHSLHSLLRSLLERFPALQHSFGTQGGSRPHQFQGSSLSQSLILSVLHASFQSDSSYDFLSAEEKECLLFLEETIGSLDTEADSGLSTDESEQDAAPRAPRAPPAAQPAPHGKRGPAGGAPLANPEARAASALRALG